MQVTIEVLQRLEDGWIVQVKSLDGQLQLVHVDEPEPRPRRELERQLSARFDRERSQ